MTSVTAQPGQLSRLGIALQPSKGVPKVPTNEMRVINGGYDLKDDPNYTEFEAETGGTLDPVVDVRDGVHKVSGQVTIDARIAQLLLPLRSLIGGDVLTSAVDLVATITVDIAAGANSATLTMPGLPAGVAEWQGMILTLSDAGHTEKVQILSYAGGIAKITPTKYGYTTATGTAHIKPALVFQHDTGAAQAELVYATLTAQYAKMFEWVAQDATFQKLQMKFDPKNLRVQLDVNACEIPADPTSSLSSFSGVAGELSERPFIFRDGGMVFPSSIGAVPTPRQRQLSVQWDYTKNLLGREYGYHQTAEQYVPVGRDQMVTFTEDFGQDGFTPQPYIDFVKSANTTPAHLFAVNAASGYAFAVYWPKCEVKYDVTRAAGQPIGVSGSLKPLYDDTTGKSVKIVLEAGTFTTAVIDPPLS